MTICTVYIGDLDDPDFCWDGGDWNGNIPKPLASDFPPVGGHYNKCFHRWVDKTGIEFRKTDFGGWVCRVKPRQLADYIEYCYGTDSMYTNPDKKLAWEHLNDRLDNLREVVASLDEEKRYALVATEF
jgi:hypothetical protein